MEKRASSDPRPPHEVLGYHARGGESGRLEETCSPLERARTEELLREPSLLGASPHRLAVGRR